MTSHRYNWKPDLPDHRDVRYSSNLRAAIPSAADLRPHCSPIVDQGQIGSCTGNAIAGAIEFLQLMELNSSVKGDDTFGKDFCPVSRLFIYYNERLIEGTVSQDAGASIRDGMKAINKYGVCREAVWKYDEKIAFTRPAGAAYLEAKKHPANSYQRITQISDARACIAAGFPFVFGFSVYESFESDSVAKTGVMKMPAASEKSLGGHAVMAVGYDNAKKWFVVRNSWGKDWGDGGYFYMPYQYIGNPDLCDDFWTVRA